MFKLRIIISQLYIVISIMLAMVNTVNAKQLNIDNEELKDLVLLDQQLKSTSTDGYLVFDKVSIPVNQISGVDLDLTLGKPLESPAIFELFWTTNDTGFNETQKAMFLLPAQEDPIYSFYLPLSDLYNFSGYGLNTINDRVLTSIRLDLPAVNGFALQLDKASLVMMDETAGASSSAVAKLNGRQRIEPIERMLMHSQGKGSALAKKMKLTFGYGIDRLFSDLWFALIWLLLILLLAFLLIIAVGFPPLSKKKGY